jgi:hypothetical protein
MVCARGRHSGYIVAHALLDFMKLKRLRDLNPSLRLRDDPKLHQSYIRPPLPDAVQPGLGPPRIIHAGRNDVGVYLGTEDLVPGPNSPALARKPASHQCEPRNGARPCELPARNSYVNNNLKRNGNSKKAIPL